MSETSHLAQALTGFYSDIENNWYLPISEAIKGLTAEQAAAVPAKGFNSVWAVVNHVRFCQELVLYQLQGKPFDRDALGGDWPPVGDPMDEAAWKAARERSLAVNQELAKTVAGLTAHELGQPVEAGKTERWKLIQGVIAHNGYHACEIISIRHMQGHWLEGV